MLIPLHDDNPSTITPRVTYAFMALCVVLYVFTLGEPAQFKVSLGFGYIPARSFHDVAMPGDLVTVPWPLTLLSYQFLHGGFMHLAGNMLYLWIFANNVEESMGHARFALFYLATGVFAALAHAMTDTTSISPLVGASGAISGVLGAYLLLYPHARILCVFSFFVFLSFRLPAYAVIGAWFGWQALMLLIGGTGNVAWMAHVGGLLAGMLLTVPFTRSRAAVQTPARSVDHTIESAPGGGYRIADRWFPRLVEAEAYRRLLGQQAPVQVRRPPAGDTHTDRIVHNADGTFSFHGRRYDSLDDAARALLDEKPR